VPDSGRVKTFATEFSKTKNNPKLFLVANNSFIVNARIYNTQLPNTVQYIRTY
jgi:hypothetical protein